MFIAFDTACADFDASATGRLRERYPLKIGILARVTTWVEFGCTDAVRITASHAGSFRANYTHVT